MGSRLVKLDFNPAQQAFILWVPRDEADPNQIMREHGLDFSVPASNPTTACLFTKEPLAAVAFGDYGTEAAREQLGPLLAEIRASWALEPQKPAAQWPGYLKPDSAPDPYPLQLADLEYALRRDHTLVADEPGVGKTPTAIMYANLLAHERGRPEAFRALAVVPASIRLQWAHRIREWSTIPRVKVSVVTNTLRGVPEDRAGVHWTVLSYDCCRSRAIAQALMVNHYNLLVLDECHYLKSPTAGRTRAVLGASDRGSCIADRADHVLALSGTPIPNRPREAYTLAKALCFEAVDFMSERRFNERFNPRRTRRGKSGAVVGVEERTGREHELQARLRSSVMVRHLKRDAMPQLRLPVYDLVYAEDTGPVRAALEKEKLLHIDPETFTGIDGKIDGAVSTARLEMGVALAPQVVNYVKMLHDGGEDKIVLFAWHREVLDLLQKGLDRLGVVRVDGRTTEAQKAAAVVAFQTNPRIGVILGNVLSLGTGTDGLQLVSSRCVIGEADWVHGNNVQCIDRLDRGGQTRQVQADIFVARGSLAEHVLGSALRKGAVVHKALDDRLAF